MGDAGFVEIGAEETDAIPRAPGTRWAATAAYLLLSGPAGASDSHFLDWIVGAGGVVVADADDRFFVRRDFLNASQQNTAWTTEDSELVFEVGPYHTFAVPGANLGATDFGSSNNFAWGTLRLAPGQHLDLEDANAVPGAAQYLRRLLLAGGLPQIANLTSDGTLLYYDRRDPANAYLGGQTFALAGGGSIAPFPSAAAVPSLGPGGLAALVAALLGLGSIATRRRQAVSSRPAGC